MKKIILILFVISTSYKALAKDSCLGSVKSLENSINLCRKDSNLEFESCILEVFSMNIAYLDSPESTKTYLQSKNSKYKATKLLYNSLRCGVSFLNGS